MGTIRRIPFGVASRLAAAGFVVMTAAPPALAHMVEAVASIPVVEGRTERELDGAIQSAIDDVAVNAIAFTPTVVALLDAKVVADRIFLFVLLADRDGEESLRLLLAARPASRPNPPAGRPGAWF
jgi:hypothetical protein